MNWQNLPFDWNHVRAFLATAELGSFSNAAKALKLTQPTLGRQVAALEASLGLALFERHGRSVVLTSEGRSLLKHVEAMGDAAARLSLAASGQNSAIDGRVSLTASDLLSTYILPEIVGQIVEKAPSLEIELVAQNALANIQRREADIAIRHVRPEQPNLIGKLLKHSTARLYAAPAYIETFGKPTNAADLSGHVLVGFDDGDRFVQRLQGMGLGVEKDQFKLTTGNGCVAWALARQGLAMCMMDDQVASLSPEMIPILEDVSEASYPTWLITHEELKSSRRIRLVFDLLADKLSS